MLAQIVESSALHGLVFHEVLSGGNEQFLVLKKDFLALFARVVEYALDFLVNNGCSLFGIALGCAEVAAYENAVIGGVKGAWRPGAPPKNWEDIRATFWGQRRHGEQSNFLLGDFALLTRFCALSQATDMSAQPTRSDAAAAVQGGVAPAVVAVALANAGEAEA